MTLDPIDEVEVEREAANVVLRFKRHSGDEETYHLPPNRAARLAMHLDRVAAHAKEFQRAEEQRSQEVDH